MQKNIAISDRIAGQFPAFIRQDYPTFVEFVRGYYESQERSGYPIDILNNITRYFDVDTYRNAKITSCTSLTKNVLKGDKTIEVETTEGFKDKDGMILIDSEVITYASRTESPKAIFTTGISGVEVARKQIELDSLFFAFNGTQRLFDLKYLGAPAFITDVNHVVVEIFGEILEPETDYVILNNNQIQFTNAPRTRLPLDDQNDTSIKFLRGFVGDPIVKLDRLQQTDIVETLPSGKKVYRLQKNGVSYTPLHEELIYFVNNGTRLRPFIDYAVVENNVIVNNNVSVNLANNFIVSIEFSMPEFGLGAEAITTISDTGLLTDIPIKVGGEDYTHLNPPKITFKSSNGKFASATTFVSGLTSITVVDGGSGYDQANPPTVTIGAPEDPFGTTATAVAVVNSAGSVTGINITNSGSGYTRQPKITIDRPPAATATAGTITNGQLTDIVVTDGGRGYVDPPSVFIADSRLDAAGNQIGGSGASASSILFANAVTDILISNFGQNYDAANPPTITISAPKGATASATIGLGQVTGFEIFDAGTGYTKSAFNNCSRAFSGLSGLDSVGDINFKTSLESDHRSKTEVKNLQVLFIKKFLDEIVRQFLPTLPSSFFEKVDPALLIKNIRDFYVSKGTAKSIQFLFRMLYGESVNISYPREQLLSPSASQWKIDTLLRVRVVSGDPTKLSGQVLQQFADTSDDNVQYASALVQEVISLQIADENIFEIYIDADSQVGDFVVPYKTILSENIGATDRIISVDSTIGWPERNGFFFINDSERVSYKEKTLSQFIDCERYYEQPDLTRVSLQAGTPVSANITIQATDTDGNPVVMSILGIAEASRTEITSSKSYYLPGDKLQVANLGTTSDKTLVKSWLYNVKKLLRINSISVTEDSGVYTATVTTENDNHGILTGDSITIYGATPAIYNGVYEVTNIITTGTGIVNQFTYTLPSAVTTDANGTMFVAVNLNKGKSTNLTVNNNVNDFIANVQNTYINNDYCYVASSGIPNYNIGPFVGTSLVPGNQRHLKRFPFVTQPTSSKTETVFGSTGQWVNGVSLYNYKSSEGVTFGSLTKINVVTSGTGYDAQNKPNLIIEGGGGTGAAGEVVVNGSLSDIVLTNGGTGYTTVPIVSIAGGGGEGATATAVISNGAVTKILIENGGTGYTSAPQISLVGGGGGGATATASVRGPVKEVKITSGGVGYTTQPKVTLNSGTGAAAQPVVINGKIESIALLSSGSGYTSPPTVFISGDGFGAEATAQLGAAGTVEADKVISITLSNKGIDYTQQNTSVFLLSIGEGAQFNVEIFKWEFNNGEVWEQQTIPNVGQDIFQKSNYARKLDAAKGYVFTSQNSQFGGEYAHLSNPIFLRYNLSDNLVKTTANNVDTYTESGATKSHSPILGWAYDGNPIYGPYGFDDPNTISSDAVRMTTSYRLKTTRENGPDIFPKITVTVANFGVDFTVGGFISNQSAPTSAAFGGSFPVLEVLAWNSVTGVLELKPYGDYTNLPVVGNTLVQSAPAQSATVTQVGEHYPLGSFIQDYEYVFNLGKLDEYNGRFCKTPEFPNGVYAYFVTIDASSDGNPLFPYIIGDRYQAVPNDWNFSNNSNHAYLPGDVTRYRDAYLNTDVDDIERTPNKEAAELILENGDGTFGQDGEVLALAPEDSDNNGFIDTLMVMTDVTANFVAGQPIQSTGQSIKTAQVVSWDAVNNELRVEYSTSTPDDEKFLVNEVLLQVSSGATGSVQGITSSESETFITLLEEPELEVFDYFPSVSVESRVDIEVETINRFESARVTGFSIENPGTNYAVNDPLTFDDTDTEGAGVAAAVGSIAGLTISNYTFTLDGSDFKATVTTSGVNDLEIGDSVIINNPADNLATTKTFATKVIEGIQSFTTTQSGTGYTSRITPSPKITVIGDGFDFIGTTTPTSGGELTSIDITNSGRDFDPDRPPVIKVEHPQKDAASSYWYAKSSATEDHIKVTKLITSKNKDVYAIGEGENVFTNRTWTRVQDAGYNTSVWKFGGSSLRLDQSSNTSYLSTPSDTDFGVTTNEFTLESFIYGAPFGTTDKVLFGKWGVNASDQSYIVYVDSTGKLAAKIKTQRAAVNTQAFTNATVSSADAKFGSNSIKVSNTTTATIETAASNAYAFGTGDFTAEAFFKFADLSAVNTLFDFRTGGLDELPTLAVNTSGQLVYSRAGSDLDTSTGVAITTGQWYHIALVRNSGTIKTYVDGVEYNSHTDGTDFGSSAIFHFGTNFDDVNPVRDGYIDEIRVSYGARYTAAFTAPSAAFVPDLDTLSLYHCENTAGSSSVTDDNMTTIELNTGSNTVSDSTWHHVALRRNGNEIKLFLDGADSGASSVVNFVYAGSAAAPILTTTTDFTIGHTADTSFAKATDLYLDGFRFSGISRYDAASFTAPTTTFIPDSFTGSLLNFNGEVGDTTIEDRGKVEYYAVVMKYLPTGALRWKQFIKATPANSGFNTKLNLKALELSADESFLIVAGETNTATTGTENPDIYVHRIDPTDGTVGTAGWQVNVAGSGGSGTNEEYVEDISIGPDNKIYIVGRTTTNTVSTFDNFVVVMSDSGQVLNSRKVNTNTANDYYYGVHATSTNGEIVLVGKSESNNAEALNFTKLQLDVDNYPNIVANKQHLKAVGTEAFGKIKSDIDEDGNMYVLAEILNGSNAEQIQLLKIANGDQSYNFGDIYWQKYLNATTNTIVSIADISFDVFREIHIAFNHINTQTGLSEAYIQKYNIFGTQVESTKLGFQSQEDVNYDSAIILGCTSDVSGDTLISGCVVRSTEIGTNHVTPFDTDSYRLSQESLLIFKFRKDHDFRVEPDNTAVSRKYPRTAEATASDHPTWNGTTVVAAGAFAVYLGNIYRTVAGGTTGSTPPTHLTGDASDGGVTWTFYSKKGQLIFGSKIYVTDDQSNTISGYVTSWDVTSQELVVNNLSQALPGNPDFLYQIDEDNPTVFNAAFNLNTFINFATENNYNAEYSLTVNAGNDFTSLANTTRNISNIANGAAGIQQFDISDAAATGLTLANDYISNPRITNYSTRIATVPNEDGQELKVTANVREKYYIEQANVVRTQRVIQLNLDGNVNYTVGARLTQANTSATGLVAGVTANRVLLYDIGTSAWQSGSGNTISSNVAGDTPSRYPASFSETKYVFVRTALSHYLTAGQIINVEGFNESTWTGNFNVYSTPGIRDFLYEAEDAAVVLNSSTVPSITNNFSFGGNINNIYAYSKAPVLNLIRGQRYQFDTSHPSNLPYYLNFSRDNLNKIEFDFRNIPLRSTSTTTTVGTSVTIELTDDIEQIIYYYAQDYSGDNSLVEPTSFVNIIDNPYSGTFTVTSKPTTSSYTVNLSAEPDSETAANISTTTYSTTSKNVTGPISTIKLINSGGFYRKLPEVTGVVTERNITKIIINQPGQNYVDGTYSGLDIVGDGTGAKAQIKIISGELTEATVTDPGINYTQGTLSINTIPGIISQGGAGAEVTVFIPPTGNGATIFPIGNEIGKIKTIKNSNFGFDYPHDYTLRPEITFPVNLQLRDASALNDIKITNPGSGYTTVPEVIISGGGGSGATAVATVRNNRLDGIEVTNPGQGYSSPPTVSIASVFAYQVNLDDQLMQFSFPHGINTGDIVRLQGEALEGVAHVLPSPSSAGLVSLDSATNYFAVAGTSNNLDDDQLRIALTLQDAQTGAFITFANTGQGKQQVTTEAFAGAAEAIVDVVSFLPGEYVYQGDDPANTNASGYVAEIDGWQKGPRILRLTTPTGTFAVDQPVTGIVSKSNGTIDSINQSSGILSIASETQTAGEFADNVGLLNDSSQRIQDSFFYQSFSYVIKSEVEINEWRDTIKNSVHPGGFRVFGELTLREPNDVIVGSRFTTSVERKVEISDFVSTSVIPFFTNVEPVYEALANSSVLFRDKDLTSSEVILTSVAKKIVDFSDEFDGEKRSFTLKTGDPENAGDTLNITPPADSLLIAINGIAQAPATGTTSTAPPNSFEVSGSTITFAEPPAPPTKLQYREVTFDSESRVIIYPTANLQWTAGTNYNIGDYVYNGTYSYRVTTSGTASGNVDGSTFTPTAAEYEPISGIMTTTIGAHSLRPGDKVRLLDNSFTFRCAQDNYATTHTYPRPGSDPFAGQPITILQVTTTTITLNVGNAGTGTSTHQFVSALPNSVIEVTNGAPTHITDELVRPGLATDPVYKYIGTFGTTLEVGDEMIGTTSGATGIIEGITSPYGAQDQLTLSQVDGKFVAGEKLRIVDKFSVVAMRFGDAANLLEANKEFIAAEAVARMKANFPDFQVPGGDVNCTDDIVDVTEAVAFNLQYGGNSRVYDATEVYVGASSLNYIETEKVQSAYAYDQAKQIAVQVVVNAAVQVSGDHGLTQFTDNTITPDPLTNCANVRSAVDTLFEILITTLEATNPRTYFDGLKRTIPQSPAVEFAIVEEFNARIEIEGIVNQGVANPYPAWLVGDTVQGITSGQTARVVGIISQTTNSAGSTIAQTLEIVYTNTVTNDGFINREFDSNGAVSIQPEQVYNPATALPTNIPPGGTSLYGNIIIQQKALVQTGVTPGALDNQGDFIIGEKVLTQSGDEAIINTDKQYDLTMQFEYDRRNPAGNRAPLYIGKGATCVQDIYEREFNFASKLFDNAYTPSGLNAAKGIITEDYTISSTARLVNIKDQFKFNLLTRTGQMDISVDPNVAWGSRWQVITSQAQGPFTSYALAEGDVIASADNAWQFLIDEMQVLDSEVNNRALIKYKLLRGPKSVDTAGGSGDDAYSLNFAELPVTWKMIREAKTDHTIWSSGEVIYRGMIRKYGTDLYEAVSFTSATVPTTGNPYGVTGNSFQITVVSNVIVSANDGNVNWVPWNPVGNLQFTLNDHAEDEYRMNIIEQDLTRITVSTPVFTEPEIPLNLAFQETSTLLINYSGQQTTAKVVFWDPGRRELVVKNIGDESLLGTNAVISQNLPYGTNQTAVIQANLQAAEVRTDLNNSQVTPFFARRPQSKSDQYVLIQKEVSGAGSGNEGLLKVGVDDIGTTLTGQSGGTSGNIKNVSVAVDKLTSQNLDDIFLSEVLSAQTDPITGTTTFLPNIPSFYGVVFERISVPGQGNTIVDDLSKSVLRYSLNSVPTFQQYFSITNDTLTYKNEDVISVFHFNGADQQTFTFDTSHDPVRTVTLNGNAKLLTALKKFGTSALYLDGTGDYMSVATTTSYGFGSDDFTIDFWIYPQSIAAGVKTMIDFRTAEPETRPVLTLDGSTIKYYVNGADVITATNPIQSAQWYHVALVKSGVETKLYVNGAQEGSTYTDNNNYGTTNPLYVGANFSGANAFTGYFDELMISNYAKYVGAFTPATAEHTDLVSNTNDLKLDTLNMLNINAVAEFDQSEIYTMDRLTYPSTYSPPAGITAGAVLKNAISGGTSGTIMRVDQQNRRIYLKNVSGGSGFTAGDSIYNASNVVEFTLEAYVDRDFNASQIANKRKLTMLAGGSGSSATFNVDPVTGALSVNTLVGGQNYASAPQVTIDAPPPGGTQALATATVVNGAVTAINLLDPGAGYTVAPNVTILGGPGVGTFNVGDEVTGLTSGVIADVVSWDADARELEVIVVGPEDFTTNEFIQGPAQTLPAVTAYFNLSTTELLETTLIAKDIPTFDAGDIVFGVTTTTDGEVQNYQQNTANIISSNVKITYNNVTPTGNVFTVNTVIQVIENGNVIGQGTVQSFDADAGFFLMNNITGYFKVGDQIDAQVIPLGGGGAVAVTADITAVENFLDLNQVNGTGIAEKYEVYDNASNWSSKVKILKRKSATIEEVASATKMVIDTESITGETEFASGDTITSVYTQDDVKTFNGSILGASVSGIGGISTVYNHLFVPNHGFSVGDKVTYTSSFSSEVLILNNTTTATFLAGQNIFSDFGGVATVVNVDSSGRVLFIRDRQGPFTPGLTVTQGSNSETINTFVSSPAVGGLVEEQEYYVIPGSLNTGIADQNNYLSLANTLTDAQTGIRVSITGTGYGAVHYLTKTNTIVADGSVTSFVKGFDGVKTVFPITAADGQTYAPPAEGHVLVFLNGVLQSPGEAFTVFGTNITFTEPPTVDSQFFAYYIGRLRKLDDIGTEFDSLRSSFNLLLNGNPYSLSLSDGVQNQVVKAENNLIITLNGILQEPGIAFNLLGSRIDFAEAPRTDSKILAFSFVGSDADVEASEIIPPIEVGDELRIQGEIENREVAVVGSSNELTTFDYQGTIEGVGAQLTPILTSGYIESIRVTNGGTGYTSNPNVAILSNTGTGAQAVSLVGINQIQVTTNGTGYQVPGINLTGGSQVTATRSAVLVPVFDKRGGISSVQVTDTGAGYDPANPPQINITNAGTAIKQPNLEPQFQDGRLVSVRVFESGAGFNPARVDVIGDYNPNTATGSGGTIASTGFDPTTIFQMTGSNAESFMTSSVMYVFSDGLPAPATAGTFPNPQNPNTISAQNITHEFIWRGGTGQRGNTSSDRNVPLGIIGLMANGVALFNPSAGNGGNPPAGFNRNAGNHENNQFGEDACGGHPEQNGLYHYHSAEFLGNCWNSALVTNPYYNTTDFNGDKARHANGHSKILGVSFDGFPIYGPYGYTTANDATSAIKRIESSYRLRPNGYNPNRPLPSLEPMGSFIQDFEYVQALGDLDEHNGRFCVTPDYPNGTYAYFMTLDESLDPAYPYAIGNTYYAQPVKYGAPLAINQTIDQFDILAPFGAIAEPIVGVLPADLGQITGIKMRSFGENYFNNTTTHIRIRGEGGNGAVGIPTRGIVVGIRLTVNSSTGKVNEGVGYRSTSTEPTVVTLTGGGGTGATAAAQVETFGKITSVAIPNGGQFYVTPPNLRVISGSGVGAVLKPVISAGSIVDVEIIDPGKGYQTIPTIAFTRPAALIRKNRNRSAFGSSANRLTNIARDVNATDTTVHVTSTSGFAQAGEFYINKEKISYSAKTATTFFGLQRGINFRYDQRVVVDSSQTYNFQVNDIINRSGSTAASKVSRVYDWRPATRELLVIFEVDELAEIDAGRPLEPTATVRFNGGVQTGCQQFNNAGGCILSYPAQGPGTSHTQDPDNNPVNNTGTLYENQISLDGGRPDTLYGLEAQTAGINTTLLTVNEVITDSEGRQSIVTEAGGLSEGVPHEAEAELVLSQAAAAASFTAGQAINDGTAYGTVKTWDSTTRTLTVENITTGVFVEGTTVSGTTYTIDSVNYTTFLITTTSI